MTKRPQRVLTASRQKWTLLFLFTFGFTMVGLLLILSGAIFGVIPLVFFGVAAVLAAIQLIRPPQLTLSAGGMTEVFLGRVHKYDWAKCGEFTSVAVMRAERVVFDYEGTTHKPGIGGRTDALRDTYGLRAGELAELLNGYR